MEAEISSRYSSIFYEGAFSAVPFAASLLMLTTPNRRNGGSVIARGSTIARGSVYCRMMRCYLKAARQVEYCSGVTQIGIDEISIAKEHDYPWDCGAPVRQT